MTTGTDLIAASLRVISSLTPGEPVPGQEEGDALATLNRMLAGWSAKNLMPPFRTLESFSLSQGQGSWTIGSGAQIDASRPDAINDAYIRDSAGYDTHIDVRMTADEYNAIGLKNTSGRPRRLFYDRQYPNGVLYFDRYTDAAYTLFLDTTKPVNQFATAAATMVMPLEYEEAIVYLLAERLAPEYGFTITPDIRKLIEDSRSMIMRKNLRRTVARFDAGLGGSRPFNFNAG